MTIIECKLVESTGAVGSDGVSYREVWHVYFSGGFNAATAMTATYTGLPRYGDDKSGDANAYADKIEAALHDGDGAAGSGIAVYTVSYKQKNPYGVGGIPNPLSRPAIITWGGSDLVCSDTTDVSKKRIENSVGDLYDGIPERPLRGGECSITRNEEDNPAIVCIDYSNSANSTTWHGVDATKAMFGKITATPKREVIEGIVYDYWEVTYPIRFRRDGWRFKPLDNGWCYKDSLGFRREFFDATGHKLTMPGLLDGSGGKLADGGTPVPFPEDGYKLIEELDWSTLSLPDPFA